MKYLLVVLSVLGLVLTIVPALLVFSGTLSLEQHKVYMIIGTLCWLGTAPFWFGKAEVALDPEAD